MSVESTWTAERDEALRLGWEAGKTADQIAADLGGFEHLANGGKNAVVGRVHRLKLPSRRVLLTPEEKAERRVAQSKKDNVIRRAKRRAQTGVSRRSPAKAPSIAPTVSAGPDWPFTVLFSDLRDFSRHRPNECRYPDPKDDVGPNYRCCGAETLPGESYCGHCAEICRPSHSAPITNERREQLRESGRAAGYASIRSRGRVMGRSVAMATSPVLDSEVRV